MKLTNLITSHVCRIQGKLHIRASKALCTLSPTHLLTPAILNLSHKACGRPRHTDDFEHSKGVVTSLASLSSTQSCRAQCRLCVSHEIILSLLTQGEFLFPPFSSHHNLFTFRALIPGQIVAVLASRVHFHVLHLTASSAGSTCTCFLTAHSAVSWIPSVCLPTSPPSFFPDVVSFLSLD